MADEKYIYKFPTEFSTYAWCEISVILERQTNKKGYNEYNNYVLLTIGEMDTEKKVRKKDAKRTVSLEFSEITNLREILRALNYGVEHAKTVLESIYGKRVTTNNRKEPCISLYHNNPRNNKSVIITICITTDNGLRIRINPQEESDLNLYYQFKFNAERRNILLAYLDKAVDLILSNSYV